MNDLRTEFIADRTIREALERLRDELLSDPFKKGKFRFFSFTFAAGISNQEVPHDLGFVPRDVIELSVSDGESAVWHFDDFTKDFLVISVSGACTVRAFVGAYDERVL